MISSSIDRKVGIRMNQDNPTSRFCSFQWTDSIVHLESAQIHFCCKTPPIQVTDGDLKSHGSKVFFNHPQTLQIRQALASGDRPAACNYCWKLEDQGLAHNRQKSSPIGQIFPQGIPTLKTKKINLIEIVLSNKCQMNCIYCNSRSSSRWQSLLAGKTPFLDSEVEAHMKCNSAMESETNESFKALFFDSLEENLESVNEINFIGGEPLIQEEFYQILRRVSDLAKVKRKPMTVRIVTNLSITPEKYRQFVSRLDTSSDLISLILSPSIDCIGDKIEYIRSGLNWNWFNSNLLYSIQSEQFKVIEFINTMSCLSLFGLNDFIHYYSEIKHTHNEQSFSFVLSQVQFPSYLRPQNLGSNFLPMIDQCLGSCEHYNDIKELGQIKTALKSLSKNIKNNDFKVFSEQHRDQFINWLDFYETTTHRRFQQDFPEFARELL